MMRPIASCRGRGGTACRARRASTGSRAASTAWRCWTNSTCSSHACASARNVGPPAAASRAASSARSRSRAARSASTASTNATTRRRAWNSVRCPGVGRPSRGRQRPSPSRTSHARRRAAGGRRSPSALRHLTAHTGSPPFSRLDEQERRRERVVGRASARPTVHARSRTGGPTGRTNSSGRTSERTKVS